MFRKLEYTADQKIKEIQDYLNGIRSIVQIYLDLEVKSTRTIHQWISVYQVSGVLVLTSKQKNSSYSKEFKSKDVKEYLDVKGSLSNIAVKYDISGHETLRRWISIYNSGMELKDYYPKQEVYMAEARRKTTIEECKENLIIF